MSGTTFVYLFILYVCYFHDGLHTGVIAQPTVSAWIVTPVADRKEGERVDVICVARNLNTSHLIEWRTEDPLRNLRWGTFSESSLQPRFTFMTIRTETGETTQEFTIDPLARGDTDEYVCNVRDTSQSHSIVATARVTLSVLYFPNESFPICSPDGPITVDIGTQLNMRCSSESGNSAVMMTVSENTTKCDTYMWTNSTINDRIEMSLTMTVNVADNNTSFECTISSVYYPGMTHTCSIGPIHVTGGTDLIQDTPTGCIKSINDTSKPRTTPSSNDESPVTSNLQTPLSEEDQSSVPWIIAFVVSFILLVMACFIITLLILRLIKLNRLNASLTAKTTPVPKSDPYMELQPTDDRNREYMEPEARETTTAQHTYYQTIEGEKEHPDNDYEVTDDNTKYETVGATKNEKKKYQNIKH